MHDTSPQTVINAFFANLTIAKESGGRAEKPIIVKRLDNGYVGCMTS
jgi:hypothetical protein